MQIVLLLAILAGAVATVAWLARRRLPAGVAAGLAVSCGLLSLYAAALLISANYPDAPIIPAVMTAGALALWFSRHAPGPDVAADIERLGHGRHRAIGTRPNSLDTDDQARFLRRFLTDAGAGAIILSAILASREGALFTWGILAVVSGGGAWWLWRATGDRRLVLAALAAIMVGPAADWLRDWPTTRPAGAGLLLAVLSLAAVLGPIWIESARRRRASLNDPESLAEPRAAYPLLHGAALLVATGSVALVWSALGGPGTAPAAALAAIACFTIAHQMGWAAAAEIGFIALAAAILTVGAALGLSGVAGICVAVGVFGLTALGLGRFWRRQVDEDGPWTTTGRIYPVSLDAGRLAAGGLAIWLLLGAGGDAVEAAWGALAVLTIAIWVAALLRENGPGDAAAALGACCVTAALSLRSASAAGGDLWVLELVGGASIWAVLILLSGRRVSVGEFNAYIAGLSPVAALGALAMHGWSARIVAAVVIAVAAALATVRVGRGAGNSAEREPRVSA